MLSKDVRKGARLLRALVQQSGWAEPLMVIPIEQMQAIYDRNGFVMGRPAYVAVSSDQYRLFFYPCADQQYKIRTRWQLEYSVA